MCKKSASLDQCVTVVRNNKGECGGYLRIGQRTRDVIVMAIVVDSSRIFCRLSRPDSFERGRGDQSLEPKTVSIKSGTRSSGNGVFVINRQKKMAPSSAKAAISGSMRSGKSPVAIPREINSMVGLRASA